MYSVIDEASEAGYLYTSNLEEAIEFAKSLPKEGRYLVLNDSGGLEYDTKPGASYKI